ncbi:MAG: hypothetical protein WKF75_08860 [Singulisphaera sp.]
MRLGWWLQNPRKFADWDAQGPRFGLQLLNELRGKTDEHGDYVHLSDGGHLENLGVYELIRRRCRYIVACDAAQDRQATSDNLANMMRMCRTDFGVRIELDTTPLEPESPKGFSRWHCAVGEIRYDEVDPEELPGVLIYIRLSMTGDEPADVQEYAAKSPDFPHQSTVDQFFDETQFESYRALGNTSAAGSSPKRSRIKASPGWPSASAPGRPPNSAGWPGTEARPRCRAPASGRPHETGRSPRGDRCLPRPRFPRRVPPDRRDDDGGLARAIDADLHQVAQDIYRWENKTLFSKVRHRWFPPAGPRGPLQGGHRSVRRCRHPPHG